MSTTAYPLSWPLGKPRSRSRASARFENTFAQAREGLRRELQLMSATGVVLSSNVELRPDGQPYSRRQCHPDRGGTQAQMAALNAARAQGFLAVGKP